MSTTSGKIEILYQDKNLIAINKPAGLLVHPTATNTEKTLTDWLIKKYPEIKNVGDDPKNRPGIVHRLDKDTSGIIIVPRNQKYFEYLKNLFQEHKIKKTYLALVWNEIKNKKGVIEKPISLKPGTTKRTVFKGKMEKPAITEYELVKNYIYPRKFMPNQHKFTTFSLLKIFPKTGRTHQIRVHLASIGHPVVGDSLYGPKKNPLGLKKHFLHAKSLEFNLSENRRIKIEADLPKELEKVLDFLSPSE